MTTVPPPPNTPRRRSPQDPLQHRSVRAHLRRLEREHAAVVARATTEHEEVVRAWRRAVSDNAPLLAAIEEERQEVRRLHALLAGLEARATVPERLLALATGTRPDALETFFGVLRRVHLPWSDVPVVPNALHDQQSERLPFLVGAYEGLAKGAKGRPPARLTVTQGMGRWTWAVRSSALEVTLRGAEETKRLAHARADRAFADKYPESILL